MSQLSSPEKKKLDAVLLSSVSQAKSWAQTLPLTNMGEVTRVLYQSLVAINQHPLSPSVRIDITEVILPYVNMALENLDRHFSARSFPLPERSQKVFDLKQALQLELAGSYQLAALDMLTRGSINQKRLTIAIGRAIKYMGRTLVNSYSVYVKSKRNIWHDVHHLYLLACENKIQDKTIPKSVDGESDAFTVEAYYKLFNLVALGIPNSLRQGEAERVEKFFSSVAQSVSILTDADLIAGDYAHIALLNSDEPAALMPISEVLNSATSRILDVSKVEDILRDFIQLTSDASFGLHNDQPMLNRGLAQRLLTRLTVSSSRKNKRFVREETAGVVMRMTDVVAVVAATNHVASDEEEINAEDDLYEKMALGELPSSPWVEIEVESSLDECEAEIKPWFIDNSSSKGYGFRQKVVEQSAARVGELIAIKDPADESDHWQIAVIRWMDFYRDKGLCFGSELLSAKAFTLTVIEVTNRKITQRLPVQGLQLPAFDDLRDTPSLIFPGHIFKIEDMLTIEFSDEKTVNIQITSIDECLGSFAYCEYITLEKSEDSQDEESDFSSLWEVL